MLVSSIHAKYLSYNCKYTEIPEREHQGKYSQKSGEYYIENTQTRGEQVFRGTTRMYHIGTPFVVQPTHHPVRKAAAYTAIAWVNVYNPTNTIACLLPP